MDTLTNLSAHQRAELLDFLEQSLPFAGPTTFMRLPRTHQLNDADMVVLGVPFDSGTLHRPGARFGPRAIREQSVYASVFQPFYPWDYTLSESFKVIDYGDLVPVPGTGALEFMIEATELVAADIFSAGASLLTLGGDHTVPYGPVRAAARRYGKLALVHLDAHQDSGDSETLGAGMVLINHGTFANDLAKENLIDFPKSAQIYIRTHYPQPQAGTYPIIYANEALRVTPEQLAEDLKARIGTAPVYLTLDIDALDPAYAPGAGSPVPGGPTTSDMRRLLRALDGLNVVAADLVEVNPLYDPTQTTAVAAAFLAIDLLYLLGSARKSRIAPSK